jgi:Uma2 family endonuclease
MTTTEPAFVLTGKLFLNQSNWAEYQRFLRARDEEKRNALRITYDAERLEFVTVSWPHDRWKSLLAQIVESLGQELNIDYVSGGGSTLQREDLERGIEPDEWYYIQNAGRMIHQGEVDLERDPPPDLAIEIEVSRTIIDRLGIYAEIGIPEIWVHDESGLRFLLSQPNQSYHTSETSRAFPFLTTRDVQAILDLAGTVSQSKLMNRWRAQIRRNFADHIRPE